MATHEQVRSNLDGLTETAVGERRENGQGNNVRLDSSRSYADIIRHNVFNLINIILFAIGGEWFSRSLLRMLS
jgi:cation-transporting ATPase E